MTHRIRPGAPRARAIAPSFAFLLAVSVLALFASPSLHAQGCIVARSPEQVIPGVEGNLPTNQGGYLLPGHVQVTIGERHQFSYEHFVGDVYQEYRTQQRTQVQNRINLLNFDVLYQYSPRISFEFNAPLLFASRKSQNSPIEYQAQGFGDIILAVNSWIFSPAAQHKGNLSLGIGVMMPTGNDDVQNTTINTAGVRTTAPVDYSIQPGNGGWGMATQWQGFRQLGSRMILYTDGDYIASQGDTNGIQRGASLSTTQPLNNYVARSDQYLLEAGAAIPVSAVRGLALTIGPRDEGVPAHNLFPNTNNGFRRPGFAVSAGPGFEYARGNSIFSGTIDKAFHRDRTVSHPDEIYGSHGDAAFATTLWLATYTYRF